MKNRVKKNNTIPLDEGLLLESAKIASSKAVRSSVALGITMKIIKNHSIIEINPGESRRILRKIPKPTVDISSVKKGMILERK